MNLLGARGVAGRAQRPARAGGVRASRAAAGALLLTMLCGLLAGCSTGPAPARAQHERAEGTPLQVFATTGYLSDAVSVLAPDATVTTLVGPGADPHTYQPSTRDIVAMHDADLVLWNGLNLEAQMNDQLESLGEKQVAVGEHVPEELLLPWPQLGPAGEPLHDPHIWNSPDAWAAAITQVADALSAVDEAHADEYQRNAARYLAELTAVADEARSRFDLLPADRRTLVTGHDAFGYLGAEYDLDVRATDFVSSEAVLSAGKLSQLADLVVERQIPVIFGDNQANPQAITSLGEAVQARGASVEVSSEPLYADSLGASADVDTYLEVFAHNTRVIAEALAAENPGSTS